MKLTLINKKKKGQYFVTEEVGNNYHRTLKTFVKESQAMSWLKDFVDRRTENGTTVRVRYA